jgi:hypothetical protein
MCYLYTYTYTYTYKIHIHIHICIFICTYIYMCVYAYIYTWSLIKIPLSGNGHEYTIWKLYLSRSPVVHIIFSRTRYARKVRRWLGPSAWLVKPAPKSPMDGSQIIRKW